MMSPKSRLSIIIPAFNEEENLPEIVTRLHALDPALAERGLELEIVVIDDHSSDATCQVGKALASKHSGMRYVRLSRNSGSHIACAAGLDQCTGDAAIVMAADLQDPPEIVLKLADEWQRGNDVVWAVRSKREGESWSTLLTSWLFNSLMKHAFPDLPRKGADFVLVSRRVIDAYNAMREKNPNINLAFRWCGFRQSSFEYVKQARHAGKSRFTLAKKLKVFVDSIVGYSYAPLRVTAVLGASLFVVGCVAALAAVVGRLAGASWATFGIAMVLAVTLAGQGITLVALGLLGEYTWRALDEARGRPRYLIEESAGPTAVDSAARNASREPVIEQKLRVARQESWEGR
jgi:glycosyltransferase involved in cell wall biosynthesis